MLLDAGHVRCLKGGSLLFASMLICLVVCVCFCFPYIKNGNYVRDW